MSIARTKAMELHLAVAQYCQKEYIDVDFVFTASDGDKHYMNLTDADFPLRRLSLTPVNDPKKRREIETFKDTLLKTNTLGADVLGYAEMYTADTFTELVAVARQSRENTQKETQAQRDHEQQLVDKQLQAKAQETQAERDFKASESALDREARIEAERINALGRATANQAAESGYAQINEATQQALDNDYKDRELSMKENALETKTKAEEAKMKKIDEELRMRAEDIQIKREQMQTSKENSFRNSIDKNVKN